MSLKIKTVDSFVATRKIIGARSIVDEIAWPSILTNKLASEPIFDARGQIIPERQNIVNEKGHSLAIHQDRFSLTQPADFRDMVKEAIGDIPHKIAFAATFNELRSYIVGVQFGGALQGFAIDNGRDAHEYFHLFGYAIDGSSSKWTSGMINRVFCMNQFATIQRNAEGRAKNTSGGDVKFQSILTQVSQIESFQASYRAACEKMGNEACNPTQARAFIAGLLTKGKAISTQGLALVDDVAMRFSRGIETKGESKLDLFHAFTERFTHEANKKEHSRLGASVLGDAADIKRKAFNVLSAAECAAYDNARARGAVLLTQATPSK